jgi:hypothetical protein
MSPQLVDLVAMAKLQYSTFLDECPSSSDEESSACSTYSYVTHHTESWELEENSHSTLVDILYPSSSDEKSSACSFFLTQQDCSAVSSIGTFPGGLTLGDEDCRR